MSKDAIERKLDLIINLLETLPRKMAAEFHKNETLKMHEKVKIVADNPEEQPIADQLGKMYNYFNQKGQST